MIRTWTGGAQREADLSIPFLKTVFRTALVVGTPQLVGNAAIHVEGVYISAVIVSNLGS